ncbi:hypothetical protein ACH5RR_037252 [Cinchona calisaya]|uniref:Uncharacterized protein n=1 Tax=Cinchona calisaya TaxID=153742 RepID=A0ABD2YB29_9GENT
MKIQYIYVNSSIGDKGTPEDLDSDASNEQRCGDSSSVKFNGDIKASIDVVIRSCSQGQPRSEDKDAPKQLPKHAVSPPELVIASCTFEADASGMKSVWVIARGKGTQRKDCRS